MEIGRGREVGRGGSLRQEEFGELQWPPAVEQVSEYAGQVQDAVRCVAEVAGVPEDAAAWAVSLVISRSFAVGGIEGRALVPLADLFNHGPQPLPEWAAARAEDPEHPETPWSVSEDGQWFEVRATSAWPAGEEVTIPYGEETTAELLGVHGLVLPDNPSEYLDLFGSHAELLAAVARLGGASPPEGCRDLFEALEAADMPLAVRPAGLESMAHVLGLLDAALATEEELAGFAEEWSDAVGHAVLAPPAEMPAKRRRELRAKALQVAAAVAEEALSRLPPAAEDEAQLPEAHPSHAARQSAPVEISYCRTYLWRSHLNPTDVLFSTSSALRPWVLKSLLQLSSLCDCLPTELLLSGPPSKTARAKLLAEESLSDGVSLEKALPWPCDLPMENCTLTAQFHP